MYSRTNKKTGTQTASEPTIHAPHKHDVLCGRGGGSKNHEGNINYRQIVDRNRTLYDSCSNERKRLLARSIVDAIQSAQSPPGKFLGKGKQNGLWYELSYEAAVEKTKQSLREARGGAEGAKSSANGRKKRTSTESIAKAAGTKKRQKSEESHSSLTDSVLSANPGTAESKDLPVSMIDTTTADSIYARRQISSSRYTNEQKKTTLARLTSTLGSILKRGPFLPLLPFDDETEKRILAEYDASGDSTHTTPVDGQSKMAAPPALYDQFSLSLSVEDTPLSLSVEDTLLLSQISKAFSFAYNKEARTGNQNGADQSNAAKCSSSGASQGVPCSLEETRLLSRMSTLTVGGYYCQSKPDRGGEKPSSTNANTTSRRLTAAKRGGSLSLSPEETRLLSQISVLALTINNNNGAGAPPPPAHPTSRQTDRLLSIGGAALDELLAGVIAEADGGTPASPRSAARQDCATASRATRDRSMAAAEALIAAPPPSSPFEDASRSSCAGSLLDDDDVLDTAWDRLSRFS